MPAPGVSAGLARSWPAAGIGLVAGLLSGLFGVGGGIVMVPLLVAWCALDQRRAGATSLLAIVPIAAASAVGYAVEANVDLGAGGLMLVGAVVGGQAGARLLPRTPIPTLQLWFGILSLATALRLVLGGSAAAAESGPVGQSGLLGDVLLVAVGAAAGMLAGLLGVGGGIIMVPGLVILAGSDADTARGTSLLVIVATAITASVTNVRNGLVAVGPALVAGVVGVPGGLLGAWLGQVLPDRVALALFAGLLGWSGLRMIGRARAGRAAVRRAQALP